MQFQIWRMANSIWFQELRMQITLCHSRKKNHSKKPQVGFQFGFTCHCSYVCLQPTKFNLIFSLPHLHQAQADCRSFRSVSSLCLHSGVRAKLQQGMFLAALHRMPPLPPRKRALATRPMQGVLPTHGLPLGWRREKGADSCPAAQESTSRPVPPHAQAQAHTLLRDANLAEAEEAVSSSDMAHHFWSIWVSTHTAQAEDSR